MEEERITQSGALAAEEKQETTLRPQFLDDFMGQKNVKDNLKIFIEAISYLAGKSLQSACRPFCRKHTWQEALPEGRGEEDVSDNVCDP